MWQCQLIYWGDRGRGCKEQVMSWNNQVLPSAKTGIWREVDLQGKITVPR